MVMLKRYGDYLLRCGLEVVCVIRRRLHSSSAIPPFGTVRLSVPALDSIFGEEILYSVSSRSFHYHLQTFLLLPCITYPHN
jgi:hypothetical protein